jgi:1-acyl-sn-glycerol-3-phosphate acyltransferase
MTKLISKLRGYLFYAGYAVITFWFPLTGLLLSFLPYRIRGRYIIGWNYCCIWWLRLTCGVKFKVIGKENLPDGPYVALAKHQSQWETFFLQGFLFPICFVLKQELLKIPFFGWGLKLMNPIAIDRSNPRQAMRQTQEQGLQRLAEGNSVLIFPEGTRIPSGQTGKFARGGSNLAIEAKVPVVPIAHNAGQCWPADEFIKHPGTVTVVIGKPIDSSAMDSRQLTEQVKSWIDQEVAKLENA